MMKLSGMHYFPLIAIFVLMVGPPASAQYTIPIKGTVINLWPDTAPGEQGDIPEEAHAEPDGNGVSRIRNVSVPTIEVRLPKKPAVAGKPTPAVLIAPGGGYGILAFTHEGTMVADWLNENGVAAILLKYRVPRRKDRPKHEAPMQDAQRAMRLVRANAEKWNIEPKQIGMLGFSAGGHLTAITGTNAADESYQAIDDHDKLSARPDFLVLVYPAYLVDKKSNQLFDEFKVGKHIPPTFSVVTNDDAERGIGAAQFYIACRSHKVPAATHIYLEGGHGYGMFDRGNPVNHWPADVEDWMRSMEILPKK